jgi:hypothetical protein
MFFVTLKFFFTDKPENTTITFTPERSVFGKPVNITCMSVGFPEPSYSITRNGTRISNETKHTIHFVNWGDRGTYRCVAKNELGNDSACANLTMGNIIIFYHSIIRQNPIHTGGLQNGKN